MFEKEKEFSPRSVLGDNAKGEKKNVDVCVESWKCFLPNLFVAAIFCVESGGRPKEREGQ